MEHLIVRICVGSSCHLKGAREIVSLMQSNIEKYSLEGDVTLAGSFCTGQCNREGVTISVNESVYTGITAANFREFFENKILKVIKEGE